MAQKKRLSLTAKVTTMKNGYSWLKVPGRGHPTYFLILDGQDLQGWAVQHSGHNPAKPYTVFCGGYAETELKNLNDLKAKVIELHKRFLETGQVPGMID